MRDANNFKHAADNPMVLVLAILQCAIFACFVFLGVLIFGINRLRQGLIFMGFAAFSLPQYFAAWATVHTATDLIFYEFAMIALGLSAVVQSSARFFGVKQVAYDQPLVQQRYRIDGRIASIGRPLLSNLRRSVTITLPAWSIIGALVVVVAIVAYGVAHKLVREPTLQTSSVAQPPADGAAPLSPNTGAAAADEQPVGKIRVRSATYGENCGARIGNATSDVKMSCDGERNCTYKVDVERLGDPAPGCGKAFTLGYECAPGGPTLKKEVPAEAGVGKTIELSCQSSAEIEAPVAATWMGIRILSATYGGNCGARIGNATHDVETACATKESCDYTVDVKKLGDPAPRCAKSFFVKYQCGGETAARSAGAPPEAGLGRSLRLSCR